MSGNVSVRSTQRWLVAAALARGVSWAGAVLLVGWAFDAQAIAVIAASATLAGLMWYQRFVWSASRVALWIEERIPELRYALVTAVDPRYSDRMGTSIAPLLTTLNSPQVTRRAAVRSMVLPAVACVLALLLYQNAPAVVNTIGQGMRTAGAADAIHSNRLATLRAQVTPPRYAHGAGVESRTIDEPTTISGLAGSSVQVWGRGTPHGIAAQLGDSTLTVGKDGDMWRTRFTLPDSARALALQDGSYRRLVVIAPIRDRVPTVQLVLPARDSTVRVPTGSITLESRLTDDVGLSAARFEYIIASGESEGDFTFRQGDIAARRFNNERSTRLRVTVPLSTFGLKPGDQLTVRAVAIDNNSWSGPGTGYSEPRTLRVPRPGEYDSLAVEPAPPPSDTLLMTLRWLIELVQRLEADRPNLHREIFVDSSRGFGTRAERLRTRVQELQSYHTSGGFPPNPLLNTAYLALVQGESSLKIAEPGESVPHLFDALDALQQYAWAERYYLRGRGADVLVDLGRVRLTGADTGYASTRSARGLADTTRVRLRASYAAALALLRSNQEKASEQLALIQVDALSAEPSLAGALSAAIDAIQTGRDPSPALQRARRILEGPVARSETLPAWSGIW